MKRQVQKGFTLIELMIVVAIIGILAAIAIPQYQNYVTKSKWASAVSAIGQMKVAIATCVTTHEGTITLCDTVQKLQGTGDLPGTWTMPSLPTVTSVAPTSAYAGQTVSVYGTNLATVASVKFVRDQTAFWGKVVKDRGIKPE